MTRSEAHLTCRRVEVLLDAYVDGDLAAARRAQVDAHLRGCFTCKQELEQAQRLRTALRALPERFCDDALAQRALDRARSEGRSAAAQPRRDLRARLAAWTGHGLVPAWRPAVAVLAIAVAVFGVTRFVTRPPQETTVTAADVARAEMQVRWVLAHLGDINRRAAQTVREDVLDQRVGAPTAQAVERALEGATAR